METKNKIITLLGFLLILMVIFIFKNNNTHQVAERHYEELKKQQEERYNKAISRGDSLENVTNTQKFSFDSLKREYNSFNKTTKKLIKQHEILRNSRPIAYSDPEIDSILTGFYPK